MSLASDTYDRVKSRLLSAGPYRNKSGVWEIRGEDLNCDFGGHHHEPYLATVSGSYEEAVEYALSFPGFIGWIYWLGLWRLH